MDRDALLKKLIALNPGLELERRRPDDTSAVEDMDNLDELALKFSELAKNSNKLANKATTVERLRNADYSQRKLILEKLSRTLASLDENGDAKHKRPPAARSPGTNRKRIATAKSEIPLEEVHRKIADLQRELDELIAAHKPRVVEEVRTLINEYDVKPEELGFKRQYGRHPQRMRSDTEKRRQVAT